MTCMPLQFNRSRLFAIALLVLLPLAAGAQAALPAVAIKSAADGVQTYSLTFQILILMTLLTLLPAILLAMTAFTRIIIVLSILRQALGMATTPSNRSEEHTSDSSHLAVSRMPSSA